MSTKAKITGTVTTDEKSHFYIMGDDGETYFANLGDLKANETSFQDFNEILTDGDRVSFTAVAQEQLQKCSGVRAIHVEKV